MKIEEYISVDLATSNPLLISLRIFGGNYTNLLHFQDYKEINGFIDNNYTGITCALPPLNCPSCEREIINFRGRAYPLQRFENVSDFNVYIFSNFRQILCHIDKKDPEITILYKLEEVLGLSHIFSQSSKGAKKFVEILKLDDFRREIALSKYML